MDGNRVLNPYMYCKSIKGQNEGLLSFLYPEQILGLVTSSELDIQMFKKPQKIEEVGEIICINKGK